MRNLDEQDPRAFLFRKKRSALEKVSNRKVIGGENGSRRRNIKVAIQNPDQALRGRAAIQGSKKTAEKKRSGLLTRFRGFKEDSRRMERIKGDEEDIDDDSCSLIKLPTHFDTANQYYTQLKGELAVRPVLMAKLEKLQNERELEARVLNRACDKWAKHILRNIIYRWRSEIEMNSKRMLMGKYLLQMTSLKPKTVFKKWKEWYFKEKAFREKSRWSDTKRDLEKLKEVTEVKIKKCENLSKQVRRLRQENDEIKGELKTQLAIFHMPARQRKILGKVVACLGRCLSITSDSFVETLDSSVEDLTSGGLANLRLAKLFSFKHGHPLPFLKYCEEDQWSQEVEDEIYSWRPGKIKSREYSPCFKPLDTRAGKILRKFVNYSLMNMGIVDGHHPEEHDKDVQGEKETLEEGKVASECDENVHKPAKDRQKRKKIPLYDQAGHIVHQHMHKHKKKEHIIPVREVFETFDDMKSCDNYVHMLNFLAKLGGAPYVQIHVQNARGLPPDFLEEHKNVNTAQAVYLHCRYRGKPRTGRYITLNDLTSLTIPKSESFLHKETEKLKRKKQEEEETGVIIHQMSQYCGMRVHVDEEAQHVTRSFCLLAELFFGHYHSIGIGADGVDAFLRETMESKVKFAWGKLQDDVSNMLTYTPWHYSHNSLRKIAGRMAKYTGMAKGASDICSSTTQGAYTDRRRYRKFSNALINVCWQGQCTTILARKVRVEEDIDDGTYTTVRKDQVDNEFRRLGIIGEAEKEETCAELKKILKSRIRDVRRIFQFYAASADTGGVTEIDHQEAWKFVKDCKLQKDRKALPSVRVDLIFQSCTIDHSKKGLDRVRHVTQELEPIQFVEFIARLAHHRYSKGSWPQRLTKMLNEDVLPNACSVDIDVFRERIAGDKCKAVQKKHRCNTEIIYKEYAADDQSLESLGNLDTMNANELVSCLREFKLVGPLLSERAVRVLFAYVQHDEELIKEMETAGRAATVVDSGDDDEMVYAEYIESLMAVGAQLYPDPYNVLNIRIDQFLTRDVITKAFNMLRFNGKGLRKTRRVSLDRSPSRRGSFSRDSGDIVGGSGRAGGNGSRRGSFSGSRRPSFADEMRRKSFSGRDVGAASVMEAAVKAAKYASKQEKENTKKRGIDSVIKRAFMGNSSRDLGRFMTDGDDDNGDRGNAIDDDDVDSSEFIQGVEKIGEVLRQEEP